MTARLKHLWTKTLDWIAFVAATVVFSVGALFPMALRRRMFVAIFARVFAPLMGWPKRIGTNLSFAMPKIPASQHDQIARQNCRNLGATLFEIFIPAYTRKLAQQAQIMGPGADAITRAIADKTPVILVSGHFGNYDIIRSKMIANGVDLGGLYRPLNNEWLNKTYVRAISQTGTPLFPRDKAGFTDMLKHIKRGGSVALLIDQHMDKGLPVTFFGKTAYSSGSAAQLALKHNRPLIPIYAIRQSNGREFMIWVDTPIAPSDPTKMTQELNDSLERVVRDNIDQWAWPHKRWKVNRREGILISTSTMS